MAILKRYIGFAYCVSFGLISFSCSPESITPQKVIQNSIKAHGGQQAWESISEITYSKKTTLFDSLGNIERNDVQRHCNRFTPSFAAQMTWKEDGVEKKALWDTEMRLFFNDSAITDQSLLDKYQKSIFAANYVFWQPYKLLEPKSLITYQGKEYVDDQKVHVLKVTYPDSKNVWWYYFDVNTYRLLANMVYHQPTYSFIQNTAVEQETGLFLNAERKSYRVDSLRNKKFLRASYQYKVIDVVR